MSFEDKSKVIQAAMLATAPHGCSGKCCALCGSKDVAPFDFRDDLSRKEFSISLMCQKCQDDFFTDDE